VVTIPHTKPTKARISLLAAAATVGSPAAAVVPSVIKLGPAEDPAVDVPSVSKPGAKDPAEEATSTSFGIPSILSSWKRETASLL